MKRYNIFNNSMATKSLPIEQESDNGEWCKYSDVEKLEVEKAELLEALKALVKWDTDFPASKEESYITTKLDVVIKNAYKAIAKAEGK